MIKFHTIENGMLQIAASQITTPQQLRGGNKTWVTNAKNEAKYTECVIYVLLSDDKLRMYWWTGDYIAQETLKPGKYKII